MRPSDSIAPQIPDQLQIPCHQGLREGKAKVGVFLVAVHPAEFHRTVIQKHLPVLHLDQTEAHAVGKVIGRGGERQRIQRG